MATVPKTTLAWILRNKPTAIPTASGPQPTFALETIDLPQLSPDQLLVQTIYLSNDPAQRGWIDPRLPEDRLYVKPVEVGDPMRARGIGKVIASTSDTIPVGSIVRGTLNWCQYSVIDAKTAFVTKPLPRGLSVTNYLGALGNTGLTAYYGLVVVSEAKANDKIVVSGAAGATGSMVVQLAKKLVGSSSVIGIAGSDEKCRWVESLGADKCLNYKSTTFAQDLKAATADGVDIYYDNVGGNILDMMLGLMSRNGRIAACGAITGYNSEDPCILENYFQIISMRLQVRGFIVLDYPLDKAMQAQKLLRRAIEDQKIHLDTKNETVVRASFQDVPTTWLRLFEGQNVGKLVTHIED